MAPAASSTERRWRGGNIIVYLKDKDGNIVFEWETRPSVERPVLVRSRMDLSGAENGNGTEEVHDHSQTYTFEISVPSATEGNEPD